MYINAYDPNVHYMNLTSTIGNSLVLAIKDNITSDNFTHDLALLIPSQVNITLAQNQTKKWVFVCIYFGATKQIVVNTTDIFEYTAITQGSADINLNLNISSFREFRLYNYSRTFAELNAGWRTQANPEKENLLFHYMLTGYKNQRLLYNTVNSTTLKAPLLTNFIWIPNQIGEYLLCPSGFVNNVIEGNESISQELPTCISNLLIL